MQVAGSLVNVGTAGGGGGGAVSNVSAGGGGSIHISPNVGAVIVSRSALTGDVTASADSNTTALVGTTNVESIISANTTVAGALQKTNNLSDVANAGTARANIHVPVLTSAQAVVNSNISTSSPGSGPFDGYTPSSGDVLLLTNQSTGSQ